MYSERELLEQAGYGNYFDISEVTTTEEGWYEATATRRVRHAERSVNDVIESDTEFQNRDYAESTDETPEGYDGHELPSPTEWAREYGTEILDDDADTTATDRLRRVTATNEQFGECPTCEGTGDTYCPVCNGKGRKACSECNGSGTRTVSEPCEACSGRGRVQETVEEKCRVCNGTKSVKRGRDTRITCPNCDGVGREERHKMVNCKVCTGGTITHTETCTLCDEQNEESCENCNEHNLVVCDDCDGAGEAWSYQRVIDYYNIERDISIDPSPPTFAWDLILKDDIEWERADEEELEHELDPHPNGGGVVREQQVTFRIPRKVVSVSPIETTSVYNGSTYETWEGSARIEQAGSHVEVSSGNFGEITQQGVDRFFKSVLYSMPAGFVLMIVLVFGGVDQINADHGLLRNGIGVAVTLAVLGISLIPRVGYALGTLMLGFFLILAPAVGAGITTDQIITVLVFGSLPFLVATATMSYRYVRYR